MNIQEIELEIGNLEDAETTYQNCTKLAVLYSIRDHLNKPSKMTGYSYGSSEFLLNVSKAPIDGVLEILDEHMETIKLLHPKEYNVIISRIKNL